MPAAAVIQGGQALFRMIGRKGHLGGIYFLFFIKNKYYSLTVIYIKKNYARVSKRKMEFLEER